MDYNKPSKQKANEYFLRQHGKVWGNPYREDQLDVKKTFLIICEGENTEPEYFRKFPVPTKTVDIKRGCNTKNALVDYALELQKSGEYDGREIWCVFDFDVKPDEAATQPQDFNSSILKAQQHGLKVAWSNDAFELWFVLHYQKLDVPLSRHELYPILKERWGLERFHAVAKTLDFCQEHYDRHGDVHTESQKLAIRRARDLHQQFIGRKDFSAHCPCTTVYLLVEELNKYIKK